MGNSNLLIKSKSGQLAIVPADDSTVSKAQIVHPSWTENLASVMRGIDALLGQSVEDMKQRQDTLIALRRLVQATYDYQFQARKRGQPVSPAHIAIRVYLYLQDGLDVAHLLNMPRRSLLRNTKNMRLTNETVVLK